MKMSKKANPLPWLAALLMVTAIWGCKNDRDELLSAVDSSETISLPFVFVRPPLSPEAWSYLKVFRAW